MVVVSRVSFVCCSLDVLVFVIYEQVIVLVVGLEVRDEIVVFVVSVVILLMVFDWDLFDCYLCLCQCMCSPHSK